MACRKFIFASSRERNEHTPPRRVTPARVCERLALAVLSDNSIVERANGHACMGVMPVHVT
nr:MAG TPA: hypothetical protein [Caudoviricetes sp.]